MTSKRIFTAEYLEAEREYLKPIEEQFYSCGFPGGHPVKESLREKIKEKRAEFRKDNFELYELKEENRKLREMYTELAKATKALRWYGDWTQEHTDACAVVDRLLPRRD